MPLPAPSSDSRQPPRPELPSAPPPPIRQLGEKTVTMQPSQALALVAKYEVSPGQYDIKKALQEGFRADNLVGLGFDAKTVARVQKEVKDEQAAARAQADAVSPGGAPWTPTGFVATAPEKEAVSGHTVVGTFVPVTPEEQEAAYKLTGQLIPSQRFVPTPEGEQRVTFESKKDYENYVSFSSAVPSLPTSLRVTTEKISALSPEAQKAFQVGGVVGYNNWLQNELKTRFEPELKASNPQLYEIYKTRGIDAYNAYVAGIEADIRRKETVAQELRSKGWTEAQIAGAVPRIRVDESGKTVLESSPFGVKGGVLVLSPPPSVLQGVVSEQSKALKAVESLQGVKTDKGYRLDLAVGKIPDESLYIAGFQPKDIEAAKEIAKRQELSRTVEDILSPYTVKVFDTTDKTKLYNVVNLWAALQDGKVTRDDLVNLGYTNEQISSSLENKRAVPLPEGVGKPSKITIVSPKDQVGAMIGVPALTKLAGAEGLKGITLTEGLITGASIAGAVLGGTEIMMGKTAIAALPAVAKVITTKVAPTGIIGTFGYVEAKEFPGQSTPEKAIALGMLTLPLIVPTAFGVARSGTRFLVSEITGKALPPRALTETKWGLFRARVPDEFTQLSKDIDEVARDETFIERLKTLPEKQQFELVREKLNPVSQKLFDKVMSAVDSTRDMKTTVAKTDLTVVKGIKPEVSDAIVEWLSQNKRDVMLGGSVPENLQTPPELRRKLSNDIDIYTLEGSHMSPESAMRSLHDYLSSKGASVSELKGATFNAGDTPIGAHTRKQFGPKLYGFEYQEPLISSDGVKMLRLSEQIMNRAKEVLHPGLGERVSQLGPEAAGTSEALRRLKDIPRLDQDFEVAEKVLQAQGNVKGAKIVRDALDFMRKDIPGYPKTVSVGELLESVDAPTRRQLIQEFVELVAEGQRQALEVGHPVSIEHELGTLTVRVPPVGQVLPGTVATVVDDLSAFERSVSKLGKVVSGRTVNEAGEIVDAHGKQLFFSPEFAPDHLHGKFGDNVPPEAGLVMVRTTAKDVGRGKAINPVARVEYDVTKKGRLPVTLNELSDVSGAEYVPIRDASGKILETKTWDPRSNRAYRTLWFETPEAAKMRLSGPTKAESRAATWMAFKGAFTDLLHPHIPSDVIVTAEPSGRGSFFDLFHKDAISWRSKSPKEIEAALEVQKEEIKLEAAKEISPELESKVRSREIALTPEEQVKLDTKIDEITTRRMENTLARAKELGILAKSEDIVEPFYVNLNDVLLGAELSRTGQTLDSVRARSIDMLPTPSEARTALSSTVKLEETHPGITTTITPLLSPESTELTTIAIPSESIVLPTEAPSTTSRTLVEGATTPTKVSETTTPTTTRIAPTTEVLTKSTFVAPSVTVTPSTSAPRVSTRPVTPATSTIPTTPTLTTITPTTTTTTTITTPPETPPLVPPQPPIVLPEGEKREEKRVRIPLGAIAWRMGAPWGKEQIKYIPPPWTQLKPISLLGVKPIGWVDKGRTPQETLQIIGPRRGIPKTVSFDLGVVDGYIDTEKMLITFTGGGLETIAGERIMTPTRGMSIPAITPAKIRREEARMKQELYPTKQKGLKKVPFHELSAAEQLAQIL